MNEPTEPPRPDDPTEVIVTLPLDPHARVGGIIRPPRPVTVGRRKSDRWLAWSIIVLLVASLLFTLYVSWELDQIRRTIEAR